MNERVFSTPCGDIHYWISADAGRPGPTLAFLPGLTADHRLFDKQVEYFEGRCSVGRAGARGLVAVPL